LRAARGARGSFPGPAPEDDRERDVAGAGRRVFDSEAETLVDFGTVFD
jgi:hypothetical protein